MSTVAPPTTLLLVGLSPLPDILLPLVSRPGTVVIFYGEGVNTPWKGESHFYYLESDVLGRGRSPFSQCIDEGEVARRLLLAERVLTF